jgi:hypothetical protein
MQLNYESISYEFLKYSIQPKPAVIFVNISPIPWKLLKIPYSCINATLTHIIVETFWYHNIVWREDISLISNLEDRNLTEIAKKYSLSNVKLVPNLYNADTPLLKTIKPSKNFPNP